MSPAVDFAIVDLQGALSREVRDYDASGQEIPYDGSWRRAVAEAEFVLAEFLAAKGVIDPQVVVGRRDDLVIRFSQLSKAGQDFVDDASDRAVARLSRSPKGRIAYHFKRS